MSGEADRGPINYTPVVLDPQTARLELDRLLPLGDNEILGKYGRALLDFVSGNAGPDVTSWVVQVEMLKGIVNSQYDRPAA